MNVFGLEYKQTEQLLPKKRRISKITKLGAVTAEDRDVQGSQAIKVSYTTLRNVFCTGQQCKAKIKLCELELHRRVQNAKTQET